MVLWERSMPGQRTRRGRIEALLKRSDIVPLTRLILTHAVYFKSDWRDKFDASATTPLDFHLLDGSSKKVPMMYMSIEEPVSYMNGEGWCGCRGSSSINDTRPTKSTAFEAEWRRHRHLY